MSEWLTQADVLVFESAGPSVKNPQETEVVILTAAPDPFKRNP
jgi:hypothetical protein